VFTEFQFIIDYLRSISLLYSLLPLCRRYNMQVYR
jgi:hypothetical protein